MSNDNAPHIRIEVREYIKEQIASEVKWLLSRIEDERNAIRLQATEYARRLDELNHAHAQARQVQSDYVRSDLFQASLKEVALQVQTAKKEADIKADNINTDIRSLRESRANGEGRSAIISVITSAGVGILVALLLNFILK